MSLFKIRYLLFLTVALATFLPATAQERPVTHTTLLGIGVVHQLDTYLSPLNYSGPQLQFVHETLRTTHLADSAITFQTLWQGNASMTKNTAGNVRNLGGDVSFDAAWHYRLLEKWNGFQFLLGPQIGANAGVLYNTRNGNNPAQALVGMHLSASATASYKFRLWRQPLIARYQLDVPLLGLAFSPNYGQSYYEIFSLGNTDHNVCFTHPFNAFSSRHLLTVDIPLWGFTLRTGYLCDIRQTHLNNLKHHSYTHAFMLGWVRYLSIHHPHRKTPEGF